MKRSAPERDEDAIPTLPSDYDNLPRKVYTLRNRSKLVKNREEEGKEEGGEAQASLDAVADAENTKLQSDSDDGDDSKDDGYAAENEDDDDDDDDDEEADSCDSSSSSSSSTTERERKKRKLNHNDNSTKNTLYEDAEEFDLKMYSHYEYGTLLRCATGIEKGEEHRCKHVAIWEKDGAPCNECSEMYCGWCSMKGEFNSDDEFMCEECVKDMNNPNNRTIDEPYQT